MKHWKLYEIIWLLSFSTIATLCAVLSDESIFSFTVFLTGAMCVVLAAKGNIWTYIFGMYNTLGYAYLAYDNGLFGEMGLNLFFFVPMSIIGYLKWRKHLDSGQVVSMQKLQTEKLLLILAGCALSTVALGYALSLFSQQNTPYLDATTNMLSIAATFLMVLRFKEQWIFYIVLNVLTICLWYLRFENNSSGGLMMMVMWSAYLVNSFYGYYNWGLGTRTQHATE